MLDLRLIAAGDAAIVAVSLPLHADVPVVVRGCTPDVHFHGLLQQVEILIVQHLEAGAILIIHIVEVLAVEVDEAVVLLHAHIQHAFLAHGRLEALAAELLKAQMVSGGHQRRVKALGQRKQHGEIALQILRIFDLNFPLGMGCDVQHLLGHAALIDALAVLAHGVGNAQELAQVGEVQHVVDHEASGSEILLADARGADDVLVLQQTRVGPAIGIDQTVHAEVAVVGELAEIAAVEVLLAAILGAAHVDGVVAPLPDEAAAVAIMALEAAEVVLQISGAVAHGVGILAQHIGLADLAVLKVLVDLLDGRIHAAVGIQIVAVDLLALGREGGALIVGQAGGIVVLRPRQRVVEVAAMAGLVAHGPNHHAGAVLVADDAVAHAIEDGLGVLGIPGQQVVVGIAIFITAAGNAVALNVGFIHDIEAVFIAHAQELGRIGIMAGADGVDVVLLHQRQIAEHLFASDGCAQHGIAVVAIDAAELDVLAVELHHAVFHLDLAQADALGDDLALAVHDQRIQIGILGVPRRHVVQRELDATVLGATCGQLIAQRIIEAIFHQRVAVQRQVHPNARVRIAVAQLGVHEVIADAHARALQQIDVAEDARLAELVLILEVAAVAPLQHQHGDGVGALADIGRHVKLGHGMGDLAVTHELAVDPHIEAGIHALEAQRSAAGVAGLVVKRAHIQSAGVVHRHIRRIIGERIADVGVLMPVIALGLPDGGHDDFIPGQLLGGELRRQLGKAVKVGKRPDAVQGIKAIRLGAVALDRIAAAGERNKVRALRQRVHMQLVRILMVMQFPHGRHSSLPLSRHCSTAEP